MRLMPAWLVSGFLVAAGVVWLIQSASPAPGRMLIVSSLFGLIGAGIGGKLAGRPVAGYLLGFLFWFLGWAITLFFLARRRRCPACRGVVPAGAGQCMQCARAIGVAGMGSGT